MHTIRPTSRILARVAITVAAACLATVAAPSAVAAWQGPLVRDSVTSWWVRPNAAYQSRHGITYLTGVSSSGYWVWGAYDHKSGVSVRRVLGRAGRDDHNTPAILAPVDKPPIVFYTKHNVSSEIRYRISGKVGDWFPGPERVLRMPGRVTYVQVHRGRTPNTLLLLTRCGDDWILAVSGDYGRSWVVRPLVRFDSGSYGYLISTRLADGTIRVAASGHPSRTDLTSIYYCEIDPAGIVHTADGNEVADVYTGDGLPISAPAGLPAVYTFYAEKNVRLFDVSTASDPEIAFAEWYGDDEARYVCLKRTGSAWSRTVLARAGRPIGYTYATRYLGGMTFPNPTAGGELYLSRESFGQWRIERWREGQRSWTYQLLAASSRILARPSAPVGASPQLPIVWLRLTSYDHYKQFAGSTYGVLTQGRPPRSRKGVAVAGDWDGDGTCDPGVFRAGYWTLRIGGRSKTFRFGRSGDTPLVGDWDGDGKDSVGVRRRGQWVLSNTVAPASANRRFFFGRSKDTPLVGDWDGDGTDGIGVRRGATWYLRNGLYGGRPDIRFEYGRASDTPVVGDWAGIGRDGIGVKRGTSWKLRTLPGRGRPQIQFRFGRSGDRPVVGDWGALGKDSPGVRRASTGVWYVVDSAPGIPRWSVAPNRFAF